MRHHGRLLEFFFFCEYAISTEIPYAGPYSRQYFLVVYEPKMEVFTYRLDSIHTYPPPPQDTIVALLAYMHVRKENNVIVIAFELLISILLK